MKTDLSRYAPPGVNLAVQKRTFIWGGAAALCWSFSFFYNLSQGFQSLFVTRWGGQRMLRDGAVMPDYADMVAFSFWGFAALAMIMLGFAAYNYVYHRQGSMSIYLMRRLPSRWELHCRCLLLPAAAVLLCVLAVVALLCIYYLIYLAVTPEQCLAPGQWQRLWRWLI